MPLIGFKRLVHVCFVQTGIKEFLALFIGFPFRFIYIISGGRVCICDVNLLSLIPFYDISANSAIFNDSLAALDFYNYSYQLFLQKKSLTHERCTFFLNVAGGKSSSISSCFKRIEYYRKIFNEISHIHDQANFILLEPAKKDQLIIAKYFNHVDSSQKSYSLDSRITFVSSRDLRFLIDSIGKCNYYIGREGADSLLAILAGVPCSLYIDEGSHKFPLLKSAMLENLNTSQLPFEDGHLQFLSVTSSSSSQSALLINHNETIKIVMDHACKYL